MHNVSGLRAGTLPGVAQQNGFLGLPLTLMQEETAYLVTQGKTNSSFFPHIAIVRTDMKNKNKKKGIAHLVPLDPSPSPPSDETVKAHTAARVARLKALEEKTREAEAKRLEESKKAFDKGGEKARLKREARARAKAEKAKESGEGLFAEDVKENVTAPIVVSPAKTKTKHAGAPAAGHFHIVPSHPVLSQHPPESQSITSLPHPLFPFPTTPRQCALLGVFSKLQSLSYRVGLGPRFGGEWLIYPGDYLRYHAHFTSQVIVRDEPIRPTEIVAWGRLGTGTKKAGLICCWDDGKREDGQDDQGGKEEDVEFYSLEWANFG